MKKLFYWLIVLPLLASILLPATPVRAQSTEILRPNDVGTFTGWDPFGDTNNWQCVDEATSDNDTTYVTTSGNNQHDSYNLQDHTTGSGTITNVRVYARAESLTAGKDIAIAVVIGGTEDTGAKITLTDAYVDYFEDWAQNPETLAAWTWADIDALEAGVRNYVAGGVEHRVTTVWLEVTYTPPPPSILNTPENYAFGLLAEKATANTTLTYFMVINNGSSNVTITIGGTDMIGDFPWTLADDGNPGPGIYGLWAGLKDGSYDIIVKKTETYNTLISNLAASANQSWGLKIWAPTSFSGGGVVSGNVTLTVAQS